MKIARILCSGAWSVLAALALTIASAYADPQAADAERVSGKLRQLAAEEWKLETTASEISFVTVKAGDIAEVHSLNKLSGGINFGGAARANGRGDLNLSVHLESVETNIPIRNERMREFLFEVARFPLATVHGHILAQDYLQVPVGSSKSASLKLMLDMHGETIPITAEVLAMRLGEDRFMVTSTKPIIVSAASLGLVAGIDKLQQLASLPSISKAVPVSFVLTFLR